MEDEFQKDIDEIENNLQETFDFWFFLKIILIRKRLFLFIFLASLFFTFVSTTYKQFFSPVYKGQFSLLISDPLNENVEQFGKLDQKDIISKLALNTTSNDITTLIELLKSKNIINPIANKYKIPFITFSKNLEIKVGGRNKKFERAEGILVVSMTGRKPNLTKNILEDLSQLYLQTALKQRQKKLSDGLDFLNAQEPELSKKTIEIQTKLEEFRIKNKLIEPKIESNILKENQITFEKKIRSFLLERKRLQGIREQIINGNLIATSFKEDIMASSDQNNIRSNGLFFTDADQGLLEQYSNLELMIAEASTKFKQDSTVIKSLKLKLNEIKPLLIKSQLKAVDNALDINNKNVENIKLINEEISKEFLLKPALIKEYETLLLRLNIASDNLKALVSAREMLQLEIAQNSFPWSLIENPSVSQWPVKPSVRSDLFLGLLFSFAGSIMAVFLRNRIDNVFQESSEVSKNLKLPILSEIPFLQGNIQNQNTILSKIKDNEIQNNNRQKQYENALFNESFRELYTSISFVSNSDEMKSILISSSIEKEGKSIISLMLAKTLVDYNQRVLFIDANMRNPSIHSMIESDNTIGLSNLLLDNSLNLKDVIKSGEKYHGFEFISAGQILSNPSKLIDSNRFREILGSIKDLKKYDYLIFDTPPILGTTDTDFLSRYCDLNLIVVSLEFVDKRLPIKSLIKIKKSKSKNFGIIVNSVKSPYELDLTRFGLGKYSFSEKSYNYSYEKLENSKDNKNNVEKEITNKSFEKSKFNFIRRYLARFLEWLDGK